jgi:type IV secretion system protein VirD4
MPLKQCNILLASVALGSFLATQLLAFEARGAAELGAPWLTAGRVPLYPVWGCWVWAWRYSLTPLTPFLHAAIVFVGTLALGLLPQWRVRQRQAPESRWATRRDL